MIHCVSISQTISISLPAEQWHEIRQGLEQGKKDSKLVQMLSEALKKAEEIKAKDDELISKLNQKNSLLNRQINLQNEQIIDLKTLNELSDAQLKNEQKQRLSIGLTLASGLGTGDKHLQAFVGIGINYQLFKIKM